MTCEEFCDAMKVNPCRKPAPRYPTLAAVLAGTATLAFNSCSCPACGGAGLLLLADGGSIPYEQGDTLPPGCKVQRCVRCQSTGGVMTTDFNAMLEEALSPPGRAWGVLKGSMRRGAGGFSCG